LPIAVRVSVRCMPTVKARATAPATSCGMPSRMPPIIERAGHDVVGQRLEIGAEDPERRIAQQQRKTEGREDLRDHRPAHDVADEAKIDDETEQEEQDRRARAEGERPALQIGHHHEGDIHADHDELAMAKLMTFIIPQMSVNPAENKRIDGADQQADDDDLEEDHAMTHSLFPLAGEGLG